MDDEIIGDLTKEDLLEFGFLKGDAIRFLKAFAATAALPPPAVQPHSAAAALSSMSLSPAPSPAAASLDAPRSLASSNFKREHALKEAPELQHELFSSMHSFVMSPMISSSMFCARVHHARSTGEGGRGGVQAAGMVVARAWSTRPS